jgi:formylglycine-generating enzyme required for sulfatase activity
MTDGAAWSGEGYEEYRRVRDGGVVIRIPGGEFLMGNKETERQPLEHMVSVSEYLIDKTEVTWGQYKKFLAATGRSIPPVEPYWGIHDDHAVVFVDWEESKAHCEWAGARLATEAEWEKAARGTDGRKFPWGNSEPTRELAVHRRSWGFQATDPATAHPDAASPYGALDMGGSVWEWCSDWYDGDYYESSPAVNPRGPASGMARVVRGGSWDSRPDVLSASCRSWGHRGYREGDFGFRCAMDLP